MNWKIESIKWIDSVIGRPAGFIAKKIIRPWKSGVLQELIVTGDNLSSKKLRILVIRPGGIGDAALLYPALEVLRKEFKEAEISLLAEKRNVGILNGCSYINKVFLYDLKPPFELIKTIRTNFDVVIDTEQWHRLSAVAAYLTRAPVRVGFATNERSELFTHKVSYSHDHYEASSFLNLVSAITGDKYKFDNNKPFIPIDSNILKKFEYTIQNLKERRKAVVGIFSGATIPERRWAVGNFAELSEDILKEGYGVVLVGGRNEIDDSNLLEGTFDKNRIINFVGKTSLIETAAIISLLDIFVSSDTGLMHVAYGVGTPTVSLFGAGIQQKWAPIGNKDIAINKNVPCSPCTRFGYTPRCPYDVRCLNEITVEEVREAVLNLISGVRRS